MKAKGIGINIDSEMIDGNYSGFQRDLELFGSIGFDYVELPVHGLDVIINGKLNFQQLQKIHSITDMFNFRYTVHTVDGLNLMALQDPSRHYAIFKGTIEFTAEMQAEIMVYHSSIASFDEDSLNTYYYPRYGKLEKERIFQIIMENDRQLLQELADYASRLGVTICLENNWIDNSAPEYTYGIFPKTLVEHVRAINRDNVGIVYDFGHAFIASELFGFDFLDAVRFVEPWLKHVHIHDNFGRPCAKARNIDRIPFGNGDLHLPIGWGEIPYNDIFKILQNYNGILTLEIQPRFFHQLAEIYHNMHQIIKS